MFMVIGELCILSHMSRSARRFQFAATPTSPGSQYDIPTAIAVWGSSSAEGVGGGGVTLGGQLQSRFGITAYNGGVGGQWSTHVAARQGGRPGLLTASGNSIPASGTVAITASNMNVPGSFSAAGTLVGISGTLGISAGAYQFTRAGSGSATSMPADTPLIPTLGVQHKASGTLIWAGKNDITSGGDMNTLASAVTAMVAYLAPKTRYLVLGHFGDNYMVPGNSNRIRMDTENTRLANLYGNLYVDIKGYLASSQLWVDTGITPTSTDLTDQSNGVLPTSIRYNASHMNSAGYTAVSKYVGDIIASQGWF